MVPGVLSAYFYGIDSGMFKIPTSYRIPFAIAVALHIMLIALLIIHVTSAHYRLPGPVSKVAVVKATAVSEQQVAAQVRYIQQQHERQRAAQLARIKRLQAQAAAAKRQRLQEQHRIAVLKAKQKRLRQAQIRREQQLALQKRRRLAQQKALALKKKQQANIRKAKKAALVKQKEVAAALAKRQAALQKTLMQQQLASEQKQLAAEQAKQMQGIVDRYRAQILNAIGQYWLVPSDANKNLSAIYLIHLAPGGVVISVNLLKSSGNSALDQSARVAIFKASPLPVPKNPTIFDNFRELRLTVSPKEIT